MFYRSVVLTASLLAGLHGQICSRDRAGGWEGRRGLDKEFDCISRFRKNLGLDIKL